MFQFKLSGQAEKFHILGVAPRIPRLNPRYAQIIQGPDHRQFILNRKRDPLALSPVS
jgi:hypothetical protein